jgi:hypothetical protein
MKRAGIKIIAALVMLINVTAKGKVIALSQWLDSKGVNTYGFSQDGMSYAQSVWNISAMMDHAISTFDDQSGEDPYRNCKLSLGCPSQANLEGGQVQIINEANLNGLFIKEVIEQCIVYIELEQEQELEPEDLSRAILKTGQILFRRSTGEKQILDRAKEDIIKWCDICHMQEYFQAQREAILDVLGLSGQSAQDEPMPIYIEGDRGTLEHREVIIVPADASEEDLKWLARSPNNRSFIWVTNGPFIQVEEYPAGYFSEANISDLLQQLKRAITWLQYFNQKKLLIAEPNVASFDLDSYLQLTSKLQAETTWNLDTWYPPRASVKCGDGSHYLSSVLPLMLSLACGRPLDGVTVIGVISSRLHAVVTPSGPLENGREPVTWEFEHPFLRHLWWDYKPYPRLKIHSTVSRPPIRSGGSGIYRWLLYLGRHQPEDQDTECPYKIGPTYLQTPEYGMVHEGVCPDQVVAINNTESPIFQNIADLRQCEEQMCRYLRCDIVPGGTRFALVLAGPEVLSRLEATRIALQDAGAPLLQEGPDKIIIKAGTTHGLMHSNLQIIALHEKPIVLFSAET